MQIIGTRFQVSFGHYQLRIGVSLEDQSERDEAPETDAPMFAASTPVSKNGAHTGVRP